MYGTQYVKKFWYVLAAAFVFFMFYKPVGCLLILASVFFWFSLTAILALNTIRRRGIRWIGKVHSIEADSNGDKIPVIEFTPLEGGPAIIDKPTISGVHYDEQEGAPIDIIYHPNDPKVFILASDKSSNYIMSAIFLLVGAAGLAAGIGSLLGYIKIGL